MEINSGNRKESEYEDDVYVDSNDPKYSDEELKESLKNQKQKPSTENSGYKAVNNLETFGNGNQMNFMAENKSKEPLNLIIENEEKENDTISKKSKKSRNEDRRIIEHNETASENFMSFGYSVKTTTVAKNLSKMFTQLENSVKNPILLSALEMIDDHNILITGGSTDKKLRIWTMKPVKGSYTLELEQEMEIFTKSVTNIKYIKEKKLLFAGDSQNLYVYNMTPFLQNKAKQPKPINHFKNIHWMRCIYHYKTEMDDWLITAKLTTIYYFELGNFKRINIHNSNQGFTEKIMCFEPVNNEYLLVGSGMTVSFWDIKRAALVGKSRKDHEKLINNILFVKRKNAVLSGGDDGFVFVYALHTSKEPRLQILQKISPSGSTKKSFIDSLVYFEEQAMLFCTNRTKSVTIFCFNSEGLLKEKSKIADLKFKVTGLYFSKKNISLVAYSSLEPEIIILGFTGNS